MILENKVVHSYYLFIIIYLSLQNDPTVFEAIVVIISVVIYLWT